jgi:hypothetical protein
VNAFRRVAVVVVEVDARGEVEEVECFLLEPKLRREDRMK